MSYKRLTEALLLGKPYFGAALRATQGVIERHQYFLPVVSSFPRRRLLLEILEIGSWAGASTITWTLALREAGREGKVTCVDPWEAYFEVDKDSGQHYRQMNAAATGGLITRLFKHNLRAAGVAEMVEVRRGTSRNILPAFPESSFDIIYIDGSHRFEDVTFDIREAKRLLRDGGVICGDDLEVEASALSEDELQKAIASNRDYVSSEIPPCSYHPGVTGAVAKEFPAVAVWNGFWAVRRSRARWAPAALDLTGLHMPDHLEAPSGVCRLVESTANYNLVEAGGRYFAVAKALGSVNLFEELLGDRALPPVLLEADSLEAVRREAEAMTSSSSTAAAVLIGSYRGFNLVAYEGRAYALREALGSVNVTEGEAELRRRFGPNNILVADGPDVAKVRIDAIATSEELDALRAEVATIRSEAATRERTQADLATAAQAAGDRLETLETQLQTRASQADLATAAQAAGDRLETLETQLRTHAASASDAAAAQRAQVDKIRTKLQDLRSDLDAISRQHQLVARQVSILQYGPGDPQKPCLAGEHRGFSLVHYQGRVYGVRKPFEPDEAQLNELLAGNGTSDVISGHSVDGVRARIDVLEDARELYAELASLDQELLATDSRQTEGLRQANATLQAYARDLERLARSWPNWVFGRFSK